MALTYTETFNSGPGGWQRIVSNHGGCMPLDLQKGVLTSWGPWWVDYNHAPPGAGYLNLLMHLDLKGPFGDAARDVAGINRFVQGRFPHNFTNAKMTLRARGELELRGAQAMVLLQGRVDGVITGWLLTGQPIKVTPKWTTQTLHLTPDPKQWTVLGAHHDRLDYYGPRPLEKLLANVDVNIHLLLFPVNAVPMGPQPAGFHPHKLRAGRDYRLWTSKLPDGYFSLDTIQIQFAPGVQRLPK